MIPLSKPNLAEQLAAFSPAKRSLLELHLMKKKGGAKTATRSIEHQTNRETAPLSYNQQGLWVLNQLMPGTSLYHTPTAARLTGRLDCNALERALNAVVARHDALRTTFKTIDGTPEQVIAPDVSIEMPLVDLSDCPEPEREAQALRLLQKEARRPFDLSKDPLIRSILVRLATCEHVLLITMHHIVTDGWSIGIFHRELSALYSAFARAERLPLPDLPIQYPDYACWQRQWFDGAECETQLGYWKTQFQTRPPVLELPTDHSRPNAQAYRAYRGAQHTIFLPEQLTRDLKLLCQKQGVTLFMTLLAAYKILLHRYTSEEDIVVGTPIAGRQLPETESLIGLFINTLAMRTDLSGNPSFLELLNRIKATAVGAYAHQDLPFERLVKELQPERTLAHNPLFQVMFVLQSEEILPLELPDIVARHFRVENIMANFDLTLDIVERERQIVCLFESNADLFESETIQRMMRHFKTLLKGIVANPEQKISELPLLNETERWRLLVNWNDTRTDYPSDKSIQELFEAEVGSAPRAIALVCDDRELTYGEINARANQLARYLKSRGVVPDARVGLCFERSPEMIVSLLGILKAGGAYVPLDPAYPPARLKFMLDDARVKLLLTERSLLAKLPNHETETICVDAEAGEIARESPENLEITSGANNLAYVIYTSGSTGKPKGVAVTHRNVVRLVKNTKYAACSAGEGFHQFGTTS